MLPVACCLFPIAYCVLNVACAGPRRHPRYLRLLKNLPFVTTPQIRFQPLPIHTPAVTHAHTHTPPSATTWCCYSQPRECRRCSWLVVGGGAAAASGAGRGCAAAATSCDATTSCAASRAGAGARLTRLLELLLVLQLPRRRVLAIACCLLRVACCVLRVACCLLPIAYCLLPIVHCPLPIACCR
jgi:hypothetical protein